MRNNLALLFALAAVLGSAAALPKNLEALIKNMCPGVICPSGCCPEPGYVCCKDNVHCAETEEDCPSKFKIARKSVDLVQEKCDGPMCGGKCCPMAGWVCCSDNVYCANTLDGCPEHPKRALLMSMATKKVAEEKCDGPMCGGKCCPMAGWVCCSDNVYCADTLDGCPEHPERALLMSMATKKVAEEKCDGPMCGGKCCPMAGWVCCSDNVYCADTLDGCPEHPRTAQLLKLTKVSSKQVDCPGVVCPSGCCSKPGFICCPDDIYCASVIELCPPVRSKINKLIEFAAKKSDVKCDGPICPGGCCPHQGYVCCPDGKYCAATLEKCPGRKTSVPSIFSLGPKTSQARCDGPICPGGCCPHQGFICCPDGKYCAATLEKCPGRKTHPLMKFALRREVPRCDGTPCPGGCCPESGWFCCPDGQNCAEEAEYCP